MFKKTCRTACTFYDPVTEECGIYQNVNLDDYFTTYNCTEFIDSTIQSLLNNSEPNIDYPSFPVLFQGEKLNFDYSNYPFKPSFDSGRNDTIWYVSPDHSYGCWIVNKYKRKFFIVERSAKEITRISTKIYQSPYPLHNHNAPLHLASRICWFINDDGWGQYTLLDNENILNLQE